MSHLSLVAVLLVLAHAFPTATAKDVEDTASVGPNAHQDSRCMCKCPDVAVVVKDSKQEVVDVGGSSVR